MASHSHAAAVAHLCAELNATETVYSGSLSINGEAMQEILVVDDDRDLLAIVKLLLGQKGMTVQCASSGEEGLSLLKNRTFLLMITDFNMPELDGLNLARKSLEIAPHMPIIMTTGNISSGIPRLAAEAGIATILAKPFSSSKLLATIRGVLGKECMGSF